MNRADCLGIIAEYNPFHNGHKYQLEEAKRISGAKHIIVCMSASFVQRGEPACADKFVRTHWALEGGADMVIELPDVLSVSCAERFAMGGIKLLNSTGLISGICFGSESGDISMLRRAASTEPNKDVLKEALAEGHSYPIAKRDALAANGVDLSTHAPNDLLGVEYLRAIARLAPSLNAFAVKRIGSGYNDTFGNGEYASATAIRALLNQASPAQIDALPQFVREAVQAQMDLGKMPVSLEALSSPIIYSLRKLGANGISNLAEVSEGLENLIFKAAQSCGNYDELLACIKTKRYTLSRLKRILINALLGTTSKLQDLALSLPDALYIRVLGIRKESIHLLSMLHGTASLPIITRHSSLNALSANAAMVFKHSALASSIRALAQPIAKTYEDEFSSALIIV